jgi:hypothetical protein
MKRGLIASLATLVVSLSVIGAYVYAFGSPAAQPATAATDVAQDDCCAACPDCPPCPICPDCPVCCTEAGCSEKAATGSCEGSPAGCGDKAPAK